MKLIYVLIESINKLLLNINGLLVIGSHRKKYYRNEAIVQRKFELLRVEHQSIALDIWLGPRPQNPFKADIIHGADLRVNEENKVVHADLSSGHRPFDDNTFYSVTTYDVLGHPKS